LGGLTDKPNALLLAIPAERLAIVEFCRWGNSLAVRIPKVLADELKVSNGRRAEITVENGTLVLRPLLKPTRKPRYTIEELLSGMTRENVPQEVDWGPPRGNEAW
jgi:antitoxin MazE